MEEEKKISLVETIFMVMVAGLADIFELVATVATPVPVVGQILLFFKWIVSICTWLILQFWLIMKGIRGMWFLSGSLLDAIANFLMLDIPFGKTVSIILTIYLANHPKTAQMAEIATGKIGSVAKTAEIK